MHCCINFTSKNKRLFQIFLLGIFISGASNAQTLNPFESDFVIEKPLSNNDFPVVSDDGTSSVISYDAKDYPGVIRAIYDLQNDIDSVTGKRPLLVTENNVSEFEIIIGTLVKAGK